MKTAKEIAAAAKKPKQGDRTRNGDPKLAETLSSLRARHNLKLRDVEVETGISAAYISQLEACRAMPGVGLLARLAAFYEVTLDDLAGHLVDAAKNGDS